MDFSSVKKIVIPEGEVKQIECNGVVLWKDITFTNLVPTSTDTDGSIFNDVGYKENVRLSSSGGISGSAQNGSVTTGFMPFYGDTSIIRLKGVEWKEATANYGGHYYVNFYDSNKNFLAWMSSGDHENYPHIYTVTRDANGVETFDFNESYGTSNSVLQAIRKASFIRITARGKGADMIVTVNEEIT